MRVVPLLATALFLATAAFAQQTATHATVPAQPAAATADAPPAHPITPEQFQELLELTGANKVKAQMTRLMWVSVQKMFPPYTPQNVLDEIQSDFENLDLGPMQLRIYQKYISAEDATQIIAFDKTPAGQRMIRVTPQLTKEIYMGGEELGQQLCERVIAKHSAEIKTAAAKYRAEHFDAPKITEPN